MVLRGRTRITRKGQVTIPAAIRAALGLREGDPIEMTYDEAGSLVTLGAPASVVRRTAGMLKRDGQPQLTIQDMKRAGREAAEHAAQERDERSKRRG
jgi:AbrB family looped-hinge helix DNA binding protein